MNCAGCNNNTEDNNCLKCNHCKSRYCLECLNIRGSKNISQLTQEQLSSLRCPSCMNVSRRKRDDNTPTKHGLSPCLMKPLSEVQNIITIDSIGALLDEKLAPTSSLMTDLRKALIQEVKGMLSSELSKVIGEIKEEFTRTTDFIMEEVSDLKSIVAMQSVTIKALQTENQQLRKEVGIVQGRFSSIEKASRDRNVEIQAVPEAGNENIISIFKSVCQTINFPIAETDIHACRRVAKMDPSSKRPRNIVVTLSSPRLRNAVISAAHRFNKEHKADKLNSTHAGIAGESRQIFISEHLSPESKQLYALTRQFAKDKGYEFRWVKYGQIYLRKNNTSEAILVKNADVLDKLKLK